MMCILDCYLLLVLNFLVQAHEMKKATFCDLRSPSTFIQCIQLLLLPLHNIVLLVCSEQHRVYTGKSKINLLLMLIYYILSQMHSDMIKANCIKLLSEKLCSSSFKTTDEMCLDQHISMLCSKKS